MAVLIQEYRRVTEGLSAAAKLDGPDAVFVVPSREDGKILRDALCGGGCLGPAGRVWVMAEVYRKILAGLEEAGAGPKWHRQVDPPDHWAILSFLLDRVFSEAAPSSPPPPGARMPGFIPLLGEQLRELLREETAPEALGRSLGCTSCTEGACANLSAPEGLLCRLFHAYKGYLSEHGLADSASLPTLTREALEEHPSAAAAFLAGKRFVFAGFLSFTRGQAALLLHLHRLGAPVSVLKPSTGLKDFADAVDQLTSLADRAGPAVRLLPSRADPLPVFDLSAGTTAWEPDTAARTLALWRSGEGPLAAFPFPGWGGIAIQSDSLQSGRFAEALTAYRIPFYEADGIPVSSTAAWAFAGAVLDAAKAGWPPAETAAILADPLAAGSRFPLSAARSACPQGESAWRAFLNSLPDRLPAEVFSRAAGFSRKVEEGATPAGLLEALKTLWGRRHVFGRELSRLAEDRPDLDGFVRQAKEAFRELERKLLLEEERFPSIGPARERRLRGREARAYLSEWADETAVRPPAPLAGAAALFSGPPPVWFSRPCFVLAGGTAKAWPGALKEAPLLQDAVRNVLNGSSAMGAGGRLPLLADRRLQQEALFRRLLSAGESLAVLSRSEGDDQGRPLEKTPFLEAAVSSNWLLPSGAAVRPVSAALPRFGEPYFPQVEPVPKAPRAVRKPLPPAAIREGGPAPRASLGDLDLWLDCPFRYWAQRLAGLEEPPRGLYDPARAGVFLHALWQEAWKRRLEEGGGSLSSLVEELWDGTLADPDPRRGYPALGQDRRLSRKAGHLKELALRLAGFQEELEGIFAPARKIQLREIPMTLEAEGVTFRGRADRVEVFDRGFIVLDYKLGKTRPYKTSLQLAAYSAALRDTLGLAPWGTGFFGHADGRLFLALSEECPLSFPKGNGTALAAPGTLESTLQRAQEGILAMARDIRSGSYPAAHGTASGCPRCAARGLCRLGEARGEVLAEETETEETPDE